MATIPAAHDIDASSWPYSGFWRRVGATMVDSLILLVPTVILSIFTFGLGGLVLVLVYGAYFESSPKRATWGKQACGIVVETADGEQLSFGIAFARQLLKLIANVFSIIGWLIFFVPAAFTERKQGLHDFAVSTVVRHEPGKGMPVWMVLIFAGLFPMIFIIGMLAAIAIPAYQDYVIRAKVSQARSEGIMLRLEVDEFFEREKRLPADVVELGKKPASSTPNVEVAYRNRRIEVAVGTLKIPGTIYLTPAVSGDRLTWVCSADNIRPTHLPRECR